MTTICPKCGEEKQGNIGGTCYNCATQKDAVSASQVPNLEDGSAQLHVMIEIHPELVLPNGAKTQTTLMA